MTVTCPNCGHEVEAYEPEQDVLVVVECPHCGYTDPYYGGEL